MAVIRHAGLQPDGVPTHGRSASSLYVRGQRGPRIRLGPASAEDGPLARSVSPASDKGEDDAGRSVYLPAARAGGIQHILNSIRALAEMTHVQDCLIGQTAAAARAEGEKGTRPGVAAGAGRLPAGSPLGDLGQCAGIMAKVLSDELDQKAQATLGRLLPGSIRVAERRGVPTIAYEDPSGHSAEIGSAGSGVRSLLAIAAGMHRVERGGTFIVEEPGFHLEPQRQLALVDELLCAANEGGIGVVVTTQSDFLVQKVLSLVSSGRLDRSDLGLYYFDRPPGSLTRIQRLRVDKTGEAEQEMFTRAIDSLIAGFSG